MQTDHILRALREFRDLVQIQGRGVGCEDRSALRDLIQLLEHLFLDLHVLEHRFDDEVGRLDVVVRQRAGDQSDSPVEFILSQPPLLQVFS